MKVLCNRTGVYVVKSGKTVELSIGENDVDNAQAQALIKRGALSPVEAKSEDKQEDKKPAPKKPSAKTEKQA